VLGNNLALTQTTGPSAVADTLGPGAQKKSRKIKNGLGAQTRRCSEKLEADVQPGVPLVLEQPHL